MYPGGHTTDVSPDESATGELLERSSELSTLDGALDSALRGPGGRLVSGFQLGRGYDLADYDRHCATAGLTLAERFATWDRAPFAGGDYAVSVHRRP